MAVWAAPITWANGPITAAQLNSVRDNLTWLKGFAGVITINPADSGDATYLRIARPLAADYAFSALLTGDANVRFRIGADGGLGWGPGTAGLDTYLQRDAALRLGIVGDLIVTSGLVTIKHKNGALTDADYASTPFNGGMGVDYTNNRLYVRKNGSWGYITFTAGIEVPVDELACPACGVPMKVGDELTVVANGIRSDGALHALWKHSKCPAVLIYDRTDDPTVDKPAKVGA